MKRVYYLLWCVALFLGTVATQAQAPLRFEELSTRTGFPNNNVNLVYQDSDGYMWVGTMNGLFRYDGQEVLAYKSNMYTPDLLTNNYIVSLCEDHDNRLWIGTDLGLNVLYKETGEVRKVECEQLWNQNITRILVTHDNRLLLGLDNALVEYLPEQDTCLTFGSAELTGIKSLMEDSHHNLWIGTWSDGLFRYDVQEDKLYTYPQMNPRNSAHVLFEDSRHRIWVGAWNGGLQLLENPYDPERVTWKTYRHSDADPHSLLRDVIYDISEDVNTHRLWVATPSGLSIMNDAEDGFTNYVPESGNAFTISSDEVNCVCCDRQKNMWIALRRGGINYIRTVQPKFYHNDLRAYKQSFSSNYVNCLFEDAEGYLWLGIGNSPQVRLNLQTGTMQTMEQIPDLAPYKDWATTIYVIKDSPSTGAIWFGSYVNGVLVYDPQAPAGQKVTQYNIENAPWLPSNNVFSIYEDSAKNTWIGTKYGLCLLGADGKGYNYSSLDVDSKKLGTFFFVSLIEEKPGLLWAATSNTGVMRIEYDPQKPSNVQFRKYASDNGKMSVSNVQCVFVDAQHRLWAGSDGGGLCLYNPALDRFESVHRRYNLPGDIVFSLQEDSMGTLWLATNGGLVELQVDDDAQTATHKVYTTYDGLQDNVFSRNAVYKNPQGKLFFGGDNGFNSFNPETLQETTQTWNLSVTNVRVHNIPWAELEPAERVHISEAAPSYTKRLTFTHKQNNFTIEFASLSYGNQAHVYTYRLEGFDGQWRFTDDSRRFAQYTNLAAGHYTFTLNATNENGVWSQEPLTMAVVILPPPWFSWWAKIIYALLVVCLIFVSIKTVKNRMTLRNTLHLKKMEQAKADELNHAKLQFFTNITHELLTPLTILSATVDELKLEAPGNSNCYHVMTVNINRLIRLLQQILEFRKAESGNLQLRVSPNDLSLFVRHSVEGFIPLMRKKNLDFSLNLPESLPAYFDSDKVDKILYNLLSNAAKYSNSEGSIWVKLAYESTSGCAVLSIRDNGVGISEKDLKNLFKRFYEGDYRRYNTIGTGIGLSLTKDLVTLHKGTIKVQSQMNEGSTFTVTIPIAKEAYTAEEIDRNTPDDRDQAAYGQLAAAEQQAHVLEPEAGPVASPEKTTILLVDDNEDLLEAMAKLLCHEHNVFTARNGIEALEVLPKQQVDLIITDILMPEMDGMEFCHYVKTHIEYSHIPILLLTAKTSEQDRIEAYNSGADGYIAKPFSLSVLQARINNLLKARKVASNDFRRQIVFDIKELNYTTLDEDFIRQAVDYVHAHLSDGEFDYLKFAQAMSVSKSTLYAKLKSLIGLNPTAFVRNIRLKAACHIMEEKTSLRISELAYAVGFNDPRYFSACFKKEFGMLPSEYLETYVPGQIFKEE